MNLRERKKAVTRESLQQAAHMLARKVPWADVTVDEIAHTAGVSRRTFFNYFDSKDAVLSSAQADRNTTLLTLLEARPASESPWQALTAMTLEYLNGVTLESVQAFRGLWHQPSERDAALSVRRDLESRLANHLHDRQPDWPWAHAHLVASVFLTTTRVATTSWMQGPQELTLHEVMSAALARVRVEDPADIDSPVAAAAAASSGA